MLEVCERATDELVTAVEAADAVVLGSPVYRAMYSSLLKRLLEA